MAEISASLVKELREKTGAGMMDCKKALIDGGGDLEEAVDWLRKKGIAAAAKKASRVAAEGLVGAFSTGTVGAVIEVNSETDFVARNEIFQAFVETLARIAIEAGDDPESLLAGGYRDSGRTVKEELTHMIATIGENMALRRVARLEVDAGVVATYTHNAVAPGLGKIGVLVALSSNGDEEKLAALGKRVAMHIAAANPQSVAKEGLDAALVKRERAILTDQARASGKPEEIIEKMVEGRLRKFYQEAVLLEQTYVIDGESRVATVLELAAEDVGAPVEVTGFRRFALGEGIERKNASEVAAAASK